MIANTQPRQPPTDEVQRQATRYLNNALNVNRVQMEASADHYRSEVNAGRISSSTDIHPHIREEGYLAQALHITGNRPTQPVREYFRGQINNTRHQGGSTMTSVGDMRTLGHRTAADDRVRNNGLEMEGL